MTIGDMLQRVQRLFFGTKPASAKQAQAARVRRHEVMLALQQEVRQLQQEISDLSDREGIDPDGGWSEDESPEMASLHRQLSRKQAELAKYQARI
ncbi:MAG TPA: hypothetical protein VGR22_03575 [Thermomicrobiales bacterium]|nr:hypothetical protein [Thermomicrobiales bacterium]